MNFDCGGGWGACVGIVCCGVRLLAPELLSGVLFCMKEFDGIVVNRGGSISDIEMVDFRGCLVASWNRGGPISGIEMVESRECLVVRLDRPTVRLARDACAEVKACRRDVCRESMGVQVGCWARWLCSRQLSLTDLGWRSGVGDFAAVVAE